VARSKSFGLPKDRAERRLVIALSATTLLLWIGGSAILPLLPTYLRSEGSSPGIVGLVMASYFAASVLTQYPAGRISDRIGRREVIVAGLAFFVAGNLGFALVHGPWFAILFRSLQGIGAGAVTVASAATIGARVASSDRGGSFGALYGSQMLALAVGPLVGSIIGQTSMRALFFAGAAAGGAALAPLFGMTGDGRVEATTHSRAANSDGAPVGELEYLSGATPAGLGATRARSRVQPSAALAGVIVAFFATGLLVGVYESCWTLLLRSRHASSFDIGLSWTLFALPFAALSIPAGRLADRFDRRVLAIGGLGASAVFGATYPFIHSVGWLVGLGALEATCSVIGAPAAVLILTDATTRDAQGEAQGLLETGRTAATALSAAASGALFAIDPRIPFTTAAALAIVGCIAMGWVWRGLRVRRRDSGNERGDSGAAKPSAPEPAPA
jgi:MFS transporter, DHA1 family, multidrug resistance protein